MEGVNSSHRPHKKVKTSHTSLSNPLANPAFLNTSTMAAVPDTAAMGNERNDKEISCGIIRFINDQTPTFSGILKKRYTDFIVNEILPSGDVVHLTQLKAPKTPKQERRDEGWNGPKHQPRQQGSGESEALIDVGFDGTTESKLADGRSSDPTKAQPVKIGKEAQPLASTKHDNVTKPGDFKSENVPPSVKSEVENGQASKSDILNSELAQELREHDRQPSAYPVAAQGPLTARDSSTPDSIKINVENTEKPIKTEIDTGIRESQMTEASRAPHSASNVNLDSTRDPLAHHFEPAPVKVEETPPQSTLIREDQKAREETGHTRFKAHVHLVNGEWKELTEGQVAQLKAEQAKEQAERKVNGGDQAMISKGVIHGEDSMPAHRANGLASWNVYAGTKEEDRLDWSNEDQAALERYFSAQIIDNLRSLYSRIIKSPDQAPKKYGSVKSPRISRDARKQIHDDLRRIFHGKLESETDADGCITIAATPRQPAFPGRQQQDARTHQGDRDSRHKKPAQKGRQIWDDRGGEYLHFTLYKENKDTMECISWLMKQLRNKPRDFDFAGTKDRRAVTTQRVCVYRIYLDKLISAGRTLRNATLGDFEYKPDKLQLGDLAGNEFVITLRDCQFDTLPSSGKSMEAAAATKIVADSVASLNNDGFLNYYGLQRFGTFGFTTDAIGIALLQGNFIGAVNGILSFNPACLEPEAEDTPPSESISRDDRARAQGINHFMQTGDLGRTLDLIPRKFSAETTIIRYLSHAGHQNDFLGALKMIQRNHRLMYVHAYQSLVWNHVVSERWRLYGNQVVEGDLVIITKEDETATGAVAEVDADGEVIIQAAEDDRAADLDDIFVRARPISRSEAESGKYKIFDVVLPTPGFDVVYPANEIGKYYESFMASERGGGLDPHDMRRPYKDFSLSGSYRNILARPLEPVTFELRTYTSEDEQFVETDLQKLRKGPDQAHGREGVSLNPTATPFTSTSLQDYKPLPSGGVDISQHPLAQGTGTNRSSPRIEQGGQGLQDTQNEGEEAREKIAVIVKMQLGSSTYATMALREVMRGGVRAWKGEFGGGR